MSITRFITITLFLSASLLAQAADASSPDRARGRVIEVSGTDIELQLSNADVAVGDVYELRRQRSAAPRSAVPARLIRIAEVRVSAVLGKGRVRAVVVKGSPWRRDRAFLSTSANATSLD